MLELGIEIGEIESVNNIIYIYYGLDIDYASNVHIMCL